MREPADMSQKPTVRTNMVNLFLILASFGLPTGCNDLDLFSLRSYDQVDSFHTNVSASDAHRVLRGLAARYGTDLNFDPHPTARTFRRDYLSTIIIDECMIEAEGQGSGRDMLLTVSLHVVQGKSCNEDIEMIFQEARRFLE